MEDLHTSNDLSYYGLYLLSYLKESHLYQATDTEFIADRADHAAAVYEKFRLEGYTPEGAQELAMVSLLKGLHFSRYSTISEVLLNEFADELPADNVQDLALVLLPELEEVFAKYELSDDFSSTPEYNQLYTELTGTVLIYIEKHGI